METIWPKIHILVAHQGFMNKRLLMMDHYTTVHMAKIESVPEITIFGLEIVVKSYLQFSF